MTRKQEPAGSFIPPAPLESGTNEKSSTTDPSKASTRSGRRRPASKAKSSATTEIDQSRMPIQTSSTKSRSGASTAPSSLGSNDSRLAATTAMAGNNPPATAAKSVSLSPAPPSSHNHAPAARNPGKARTASTSDTDRTRSPRPSVQRRPQLAHPPTLSTAPQANSETAQVPAVAGVTPLESPLPQQEEQLPSPVASPTVVPLDVFSSPLEPFQPSTEVSSAPIALPDSAPEEGGQSLPLEQPAGEFSSSAEELTQEQTEWEEPVSPVQGELAIAQEWLPLQIDESAINEAGAEASAGHLQQAQDSLEADTPAPGFTQDELLLSDFLDRDISSEDEEDILKEAGALDTLRIPVTATLVSPLDVAEEVITKEEETAEDEARETSQSLLPSSTVPSSAGRRRRRSRGRGGQRRPEAVLGLPQGTIAESNLGVDNGGARLSPGESQAIPGQPGQPQPGQQPTPRPGGQQNHGQNRTAVSPQPQGPVRPVELPYALPDEAGEELAAQLVTGQRSQVQPQPEVQSRRPQTRGRQRRLITNVPDIFAPRTFGPGDSIDQPIGVRHSGPGLTSHISPVISTHSQPAVPGSQAEVMRQQSRVANRGAPIHPARKTNIRSLPPRHTPQHPQQFQGTEPLLRLSEILQLQEATRSLAPSSGMVDTLQQAIEWSTEQMLSELRKINSSPPNVNVQIPPFPSTERVGVFVDVANLMYSARNLRLNIDFGRMLQYLKGNRRLIRAHAYCPTDPEPNAEQVFVNAVKGMGYRITTKNFKTFTSGAKKADLDLDLCMDIVRLVDAAALDCVSLVSGDSDFQPVLQYCSDHGVRVEVAAFDEAMSQQLRATCDLFINLSTLAEIRY